jgi:hypothetical protein
MATTNGDNGKRAGIGDDAVRAKTGKSWKEWISALDKAGARTMSHQEIAALVDEKFGVGPGWTQMVTVGYEQAVGKRVRLQKADGFAISASKTLPADIADVFRSFSDARRRKSWLKDDITIRKATAPKSLRITWKDGVTHVDVNLYARSAGKTQVSLQHTKLGSERDAAKVKAFWASALAKLGREFR